MAFSHGPEPRSVLRVDRILASRERSTQGITSLPEDPVFPVRVDRVACVATGDGRALALWDQRTGARPLHSVEWNGAGWSGAQWFLPGRRESFWGLWGVHGPGGDALVSGRGSELLLHDPDGAPDALVGFVDGVWRDPVEVVGGARRIDGFDVCHLGGSRPAGAELAVAWREDETVWAQTVPVRGPGRWSGQCCPVEHDDSVPDDHQSVAGQ